MLEGGGSNAPLPLLLYANTQAEIPTFWADKDPLDSNTTILSWIQHCQDSDLIEEITEEMLEKLIANTDQGICSSMPLGNINICISISPKYAYLLIYTLMKFLFQKYKLVSITGCLLYCDKLFLCFV